MMDNREEEHADGELVALFMRHVVPVLFRLKRDSRSEHMVMTAFVLSVAEEWFLVTAGHCIAEIEEITDVHGFQIAGCWLIDSLGLGAEHSEPIPFAYADSYPVQLSKEQDFDYGVMVLSPYYRLLLEKNGVQPLNEEVWKLQPSNVDFYLLLGVPGELVRCNSQQLQIVSSLHRLQRVEERPRGFSATELPLFYGHIALGPEMTSIKGMSGGPILGFRYARGELRYWLIALQSRWLPESHYIAACPTRILGERLETLIRVYASGTPASMD